MSNLIISASFSTWYREYFANSSGSYNKLGHFKYKSEDFSQPIQLKYSYPYVSVGQFKPATNILDGIGIRVDRFGFIDEGYWKDGKQDVCSISWYKPDKILSIKLILLTNYSFSNKYCIFLRNIFIFISLYFNNVVFY